MAVEVGVSLGVGVKVGVAVFVGLDVGVWVGVREGIRVGVEVGVGVLDGIGVGVIEAITSFAEFDKNCLFPIPTKGAPHDPTNHTINREKMASGINSFISRSPVD